MPPYPSIVPGGPGWGLALLLSAVLAAPGTAQVARPDSTPPAADSARPAVADSLARARADTTPVTPARADTTPVARARPDSTPAGPVAPVDSVLAAACAGGGGLAADLLAVLFTPAAADSDRTALAKAVDGTIAGPADAVRPGAYYLRVANGDLDPTVADRVIRAAGVQEVGPVPCPAR